MSKRIKEVILHKSMNDINFAREVLTNLPKHLFSDESEEMKYIYTAIKRKSHTSEHISTESLAIKIEDIMTKNKCEEDTITNTIQYMDNLTKVKLDNEDDSINSEINKYVKTEMSKNVLTKFIIENKQEDSDNLTELVEKLKEIEVKDIAGTSGELIDFFADTDKKLHELKHIAKNKFSTGFASIDEQIEGGIARGEVGLVMAPTGRGKSLMASNLAKNYVRSGLNVLYVALEENMDRMILRAEQQMLGVEKKHLIDENMQLNEDVYKALQKKYEENRPFFGEYFLSKHMPQQVSPNDLEQLIVNTRIKYDKRIDVVIIDYPHLMRNPYARNYSESDAGGKLFEEIRRLAQQYQFVCWTLAQTNRTAYGAEVITSEHVEGSRKILNAVEVALAVNQKDEEFKNGYLRLYLDKIRNSSNTGERFVHLKVEPSKMRVRDETPEEEAEHKQLLSDNGKDRPNTFDKKQSKIETINNNFGGIEI